MIFINDRPGQLGNQLWLSAPLIALCLEHDVLYVNLYFENNYHLFENLNTHKKIKFGLISKIKDIYLRKVLLRLVKKTPNCLLKPCKLIVDKVNWRNETWPVETFVQKNNIVFVGAPVYPHSYILLQKHHKELTYIFKPKNIYAKRVENHLNTIRQNADVLVGLHIRRGDYKEFLGGVYYFEDAVYLSYMQQITRMINGLGKSVHFFISSNEKIQIKNFAPFSISHLGNALSIEDMFALSKCDYILGVPSTFSMWASFYGKVPLRFIKYQNEYIQLKEFSIIIAQDLFENGEKLEHVNS